MAGPGAIAAIPYPGLRRVNRLESDWGASQIQTRGFRNTDISIQDLASVAEIPGPDAVVESLGYPGRQIHQANAQSQADARYLFLDACGQMNLTVAATKELASIFRRAMQGLDLDEDETVQYFVLLGQFLNTWSLLFDLYKDRHLPNTQWTVIRKDIITM
jgi:hypothetical protein